MPYTPPSQRSPATSKPSSPIISRNHSYSEGVLLPSSRPTSPALPRSVSSTSYLSKHRRSPSISTQNNTQANGQAANDDTGLSSDPRRVRGPSANGAITTPPDSSDDEERGRDLGNLKELHEALEHIDVKRGNSPSRDGAGESHTKTPPSAPSPGAAPPLSAEARKMSHSRSSSEITLSIHHASDMHAIHSSSSENSDDEDDGLRMKPPLLRKKSGELVKPALRPASRRRPSSMPGTPTFSKAVHFNENMEQVRHFLHADRPIAVSAGSSPVEVFETSEEYPFGYDDGYRSSAFQWEVKLANFPADTYERKTAPVRVERIFLASDKKTLVGTVAVANISFQKYVVARFTLDYWKTTSEVVAEYNHDVRKKLANDGYDRFNFNIKLADQANLESKTLLLCVKYSVNGVEHWDNNNNMNYQVDFIKKTKPKSSSVHVNHSVPTIPRSRHSPPATRPRSVPSGSLDDDFGHDFGSKFEFGASGKITMSDSPSASIRLKPKSKRGTLFPDQASRRSPQNQAFSSRYDFSASLTSALSTAQSAMGSRSGIKPKDEPRTIATATATAAAPVPGTRPDSLSSDKPGLQSAEYNELIQKFCFFGTPSGRGSPKASTPVRINPQADGVSDYLNKGFPSLESSASSSPPSPAMPLLVDGANETNTTHFTPRSMSPGPVTGSGLEDLLNPSFQYGYNMHGGIFPERSHTPQACV